MDEQQAEALYLVMQQAYTDTSYRDDSWPAKLAQPFKVYEEQFVGKANLKAMYKNEATKPPPVFDASNTRVAEDFLLTSGSLINVFVEFVPFKMTTTGVSLRLKGVQVLKYVPYVPPSPFEAQEGYVNGADTTAEPASEPEPQAMFSAFPPVEEDIPDVVPEPVKRATKKVKPIKKETDLASVIDKWSADGS